MKAHPISLKEKIPRDFQPKELQNAHGFIALLPSIQFKGLRRPDGYPAELKTLGDHIRATRLERGEHQKDVAKAIGVCTHTIMNWELNRHEVATPNYPAVMTYLGYCPIPEGIQGDSLGALVRRFRIHRGETLSQAALLMGVDSGALSAWEAGLRDPTRSSQAKIRRYVQDLEIA